MGETYIQIRVLPPGTVRLHDALSILGHKPCAFLGAAQPELTAALLDQPLGLNNLVRVW